MEPVLTNSYETAPSTAAHEIAQIKTRRCVLTHIAFHDLQRAHQMRGAYTSLSRRASRYQYASWLSGCLTTGILFVYRHRARKRLVSLPMLIGMIILHFRHGQLESKLYRLHRRASKELNILLNRAASELSTKYASLHQMQRHQIAPNNLPDIAHKLCLDSHQLFTEQISNAIVGQLIGYKSDDDAAISAEQFLPKTKHYIAPTRISAIVLSAVFCYSFWGNVKGVCFTLASVALLAHLCERYGFAPTRIEITVSKSTGESTYRNVAPRQIFQAKRVIDTIKRVTGLQSAHFLETSLVIAAMTAAYQNQETSDSLHKLHLLRWYGSLPSHEQYIIEGSLLVNGVRASVKSSIQRILLGSSVPLDYPQSVCNMFYIAALSIQAVKLGQSEDASPIDRAVQGFLYATILKVLNGDSSAEQQAREGLLYNAYLTSKEGIICIGSLLNFACTHLMRFSKESKFFTAKKIQPIFDKASEAFEKT